MVTIIPIEPEDDEPEDDEPERCDRCGAAPADVGCVLTVVLDGRASRAYVLCDRCDRELDAWLDGPVDPSPAGEPARE